MEEIKIIIQEQKPSILCISEFNMDHRTFPTLININDYNLEIDNYYSEGKKSRLGIYIHKTTNYTRRKNLETKNLATVWIEINPKKPSKWLLCGTYREWCEQGTNDKAKSRSHKEQITRMEAWQRQVLEADKEKIPILLCGDINIDTTPWTHPESPKTKYQKQQKSLLQLLQNTAGEIGLILLNTSTTRQQGQNRPSTLDLYLTNEPQKYQNTRTLVSTSDHYMVITERNGKVKPNPQ